jgi:hypothetical protein
MSVDHEPPLIDPSLEHLFYQEVGMFTFNSGLLLIPGIVIVGIGIGRVGRGVGVFFDVGVGDGVAVGDGVSVGVAIGDGSAGVLPADGV